MNEPTNEQEGTADTGIPTDRQTDGWTKHAEQQKSHGHTIRKHFVWQFLGYGF